MRDSLQMLNRRLNEIREDERAAISREIHDNPGQYLTALKIDIQFLLERLPRDSEESLKLEAMSILIADDHEVVREGLKQIIRKVNPFAGIEEASTGTGTLALLEKNSYDLPGRYSDIMF
jgi:glucose-6-phosphate-specific signal transduction histidine kinase